MQSVARSAAACLEGERTQNRTVRETPRLPDSFIVVLDHAAELGLNASEQALVAQLWRYWWAKGRDPFPSAKLLGEKLGLAERQVRRLIASVQEKRLVAARVRSRDDGGQTSNYYSLEPLLAAALALDALSDSTERGVTGDRGPVSDLTGGSVTDDRGPVSDLTGQRTPVTGREPKNDLEPEELKDTSTHGEPFQGSSGRPDAVSELPTEAPIDPEATRIWEAALVELRLMMSQANFESYLAGTTGMAFDGDQMTVDVTNPLVREALEQRFRQHILRALFDVVSRPCRVRLTSTPRHRAETLL